MSDERKSKKHYNVLAIKCVSLCSLARLGFAYLFGPKQEIRKNSHNEAAMRCTWVREREGKTEVFCKTVLIIKQKLPY